MDIIILELSMVNNSLVYGSYRNPLANRYATSEMLYNFSAEHMFRTWRQIWITLAEVEKELGLPISQAQINELKRFKDRINYTVAERFERELKHEVMAHIKAYGAQCPRAKPIIHLGATSALIVDNADLMIYKKALEIIKKKLVQVIKHLSQFALTYQDLPTLGFTHFQPALLTTVGKRACLWLNDLIIDLKNLEYQAQAIRFLGAKGAVGTQASFLALFNHDPKKVRKLDRLLTKRLGFNESYIVTGQTYPRKVDYQMLTVLSGIAQSAHKFSNDLRLLQGLGELEEPFGHQQVGSSAMAYKRNPIHTERMTSLARLIICAAQNAAFTGAQQWLERTLDDSANRRIILPESFLATDALLALYGNLTRNLTVYPEVINQHVQRELPFLVTEDILSEAVKAGGDRQELHERIRFHSMKVAREAKQGRANDLLDRLVRDPLFSKMAPQLKTMLNPIKYVGLAPVQVKTFIQREVKPILRKYRDLLEKTCEEVKV